MKRKYGWGAAALVVALSVAAPAFADNYVNGKANPGSLHTGQAVGGISVADSTYYTLRVTADGYLRVDDADRDRDAAKVVTVFSGSTLTAAAPADSAVVDFSGYAVTGLLIDTDSEADLIVQLRYCVDGVDDSTHTFPLAVTPYARGVGALAAGDSLASSITAGPMEIYIPIRGSRVGQTALAFRYPLGNVFVPIGLGNGLTLPRIDWLGLRVRAAVISTAAGVTVTVKAVGSALR